MKLCRFDDHRLGLVRGNEVIDVTPLARGGTHGAADPLLALPPVLRSASTDTLAALQSKPLEAVRLLSPIQSPGKIVGAPVNYQAHVAEMLASNISPGHNIPDIDRAGLFLKATSSLVGPGEGIAQRFLNRRTDFEIELVAVIGRTASEVAQEDALEYVAGYCLGLDVTIRGTEDRSFRKSMDSYSVVGPWLTTADDIADPNALNIRLYQNGELRQNGHTADLIYNVQRIIAFASSFYTLHPGDILFTGTPEGVGPMRPGDLLRAECNELGAMDVRVRAHRLVSSEAA